MFVKLNHFPMSGVLVWWRGWQRVWPILNCVLARGTENLGPTREGLGLHVSALFLPQPQVGTRQGWVQTLMMYLP